MEKDLICKICGGQMIEGFVLELPRCSYKTEYWVKGPMEKSFFTGIKYFTKRRHPVMTYCCNKCGHLDYYVDFTYPKEETDKK